MKLFSRLLFILLSLSISGYAQTSTMKFDREVWDFGTIKEVDGKVSCKFTFTNTGRKPFVIENVATTCGCTTPEYTRAPILPNRKGTIDVTFDPAGRPGVFSKDIFVTSDGGKNRNKITIKGNVTERPRTVEDVYPLAVGGGLRVNMVATGHGYTPRGATKSVTVDYYNTSDKNIEITILNSDPKPYFNVALSTNKLAPKESGVMTITYDLRHNDIWGRLQNEFNLAVDGRKCNLKFSAAAIAADDFSNMSQAELNNAPKAMFVSQYYNFGNVEPSQRLTRKFTLSNEGGSPLVVRHIKCGNGVSTSLKAGQSIAVGGELNFDVMLNALSAAGKITGEIEIIFNDPDRTLREVRVAATVINN